VDDTSLLAGADAIEAGLCREVAAGIERRQARAAEFSGNQPVSAPVAAGAAGAADSDRSALTARFRSFTWGGVLLAGLVDSINPCAIATLVFFMSLLVSTGVRGVRLAAAGLAFAAGSYAMYFCLGIGLIHALRACMAWKWLRAALDGGMVMALVVLAILSFRDAWRYFRGHQAGDVLLQLPAGLKQRIHARLRGVARARSLVIGGAAAGAIVTALESVCTGQVYLPTLVLIMREEGSGLAFKYLAGYNLMFIVPMLAILALVMGGLRTIELVAWSRRSVVTGKVLMGMLFIGMAVLVILL
jgi:cytochrome c biogenesis protein CcdA